MATIGQHKPLLLEQIKRENPGIDRIKQVLQAYEDLSLNDLRGTISDEMYTMLLDEVRSPEEGHFGRNAPTIHGKPFRPPL